MNASVSQWVGLLHAIIHAPCSQATKTSLHAISMHYLAPYARSTMISTVG